MIFAPIVQIANGMSLFYLHKEQIVRPQHLHNLQTNI